MPSRTLLQFSPRLLPLGAGGPQTCLPKQCVCEAACGMVSRLLESPVVWLAFGTAAWEAGKDIRDTLSARHSAAPNAEQLSPGPGTPLAAPSREGGGLSTPGKCPTTVRRQRRPSYAGPSAWAARGALPVTRVRCSMPCLSRPSPLWNMALQDCCMI